MQPSPSIIHDHDNDTRRDADADADAHRHTESSPSSPLPILVASPTTAENTMVRQPPHIADSDVISSAYNTATRPPPHPTKTASVVSLGHQADPSVFPTDSRRRNSLVNQADMPRPVAMHGATTASMSLVPASNKGSALLLDTECSSIGRSAIQDPLPAATSHHRMPPQQPLTDADDTDVPPPDQALMPMQATLDTNEQLLTPFQKNLLSCWNTLAERLSSPVKSDEKWYQWWSRIIFSLQLAHIYIMPLLMAFSPELLGDSTSSLVIFGVTAFSLDMLLLIHVYFQARIIPLNDWGEEIDGKTAIHHYMFERMGILEVASALPWDLLALAVPCTMLPSGWGCYQSRLWALLRTIKSILGFPLTACYNASIPGLPLPVSRLCKSLIFFMLMGHIDGCLFWVVDISLPPGQRWIDLNSALDGHTGWMTHYPDTLLGALASLVLKLRGAYVSSECIFVLFEFIAGILAYGTLFAEVFAVLRMFDESATQARQDVEHRLHMDNVREYMRQNKLPPAVQDQVLAYKEIQYRRIKGVDEARLFDDIPTSVQHKIQEQLYMDLVRTVPLFADMDDRIRQAVCICVKPLMLLDGWILFNTGDDAHEMYFIKSGHIEICIGPEQRVVATLGPGNFFGELALFDSDSGKRSATTRGKGTTELCVLSKTDFQSILSRYPAAAERVAQAVIERREERRKNEEAVAAQRQQEQEAATAAVRTSTYVTKVVEASTRILSRALGSHMSLSSAHGTRASGQESPMSRSSVSFVRFRRPLSAFSATGVTKVSKRPVSCRLSNAVSIQVDSEDVSSLGGDGGDVQQENVRQGNDEYTSDDYEDRESEDENEASNQHNASHPSVVQPDKTEANQYCNIYITDATLPRKRSASPTKVAAWTDKVAAPLDGSASSPPKSDISKNPSDSHFRQPKKPSILHRSKTEEYSFSSRSASLASQAPRGRMNTSGKSLHLADPQKSSVNQVTEGAKSRLSNSSRRNGTGINISNQSIPTVRFKESNTSLDQQKDKNSAGARRPVGRRPTLRTLTLMLAWPIPEEAKLSDDPLVRELHLRTWKRAFWRRRELYEHITGPPAARARAMSI
ncbi:hypothetical protein SeLEV6574_g04894 [Synchytrium endobioticum]|uniref:Cyclic nucleotide-binding domain-containing protein n=1 Tax=Synchytrium endobioticum TaxID=286115 RepID=A0A507CX14_9FUNG|nr:hypothetical protein SeLEV6574_g04894 [Synchytrium endobioticum]